MVVNLATLPGCAAAFDVQNFDTKLRQFGSNEIRLLKVFVCASMIAQC